MTPAASSHLSDDVYVRYRTVARREIERNHRELQADNNNNKYPKPARTTRVKGFEPDVLDHRSTAIARQHCFTAIGTKAYDLASVVFVGSDFIRENINLI